MNELLDIYWSNYLRLLFNQNVPNHLVSNAYKVFITLHRRKNLVYLDIPRKH